MHIKCEKNNIGNVGKNQGQTCLVIKEKKWFPNFILIFKKRSEI